MDLAIRGPKVFNFRNLETFGGRGGSALNHRGFSRSTSKPWFVTERSGVLLHRALRNPRCFAHGMPAVTTLQRSDEPVSIAITEFRPPQDFASRTRPLETGFRTLADLLALELCKRGGGSQEDVSDELVFVDKRSSV